MSHRDELRARLLVVAIAVSSMLFLLSVFMFVGSVKARTQLAENAERVDAVVLAAYPGRTGSIDVQYHYQEVEWQSNLRCGVSCPKTGDHVTLLVSPERPDDPALAGSSLASTDSVSVSLYAMVATGITLALSLFWLRQTKHRAQNVNVVDERPHETPTPAKGFYSRDPHYHPLVVLGLLVFAFGTFGVATIGENAVFGQISTGLSLLCGALFFYVLVRKLIHRNSQP